MAQPTTSAPRFWGSSSLLQRPASHGENIQPGPGPNLQPRRLGKLQPVLPKSYRKNRPETAGAEGLGDDMTRGTTGSGQAAKSETNHSSGNKEVNQSLLQFRPRQEFVSNSPSVDIPVTPRRPLMYDAKLPQRPGTVGARPQSQGQGHGGKPNVYRSSATGQNVSSARGQFVPLLPSDWSGKSLHVHQAKPQASAQVKANSAFVAQQTAGPSGLVTGNLSAGMSSLQNAAFAPSPLAHTATVAYAEGLKQENRNFTIISSKNAQSPLAQNFVPIQRYLYPKTIPKFGIDECDCDELQPEVSILRTCHQCAPIPIEIVFNNLSKIQKIGEGVYGEVYVGNFLNQTPPSVYKIVAVEGDKPVNGEKQKRFEEIEPEIIVSQRLNTILFPNPDNYTTGFAQLHRARVLQGKYPSTCTLSWKQWDRENRSENECPNFDEDQRYVVFEYQNGGTDIESYKFTNAQQAFACLIQVVHTLGVAECAIQFEHRDLHWGNILVTRTDDPTVTYTMNGVDCVVSTCGIKSTIIDFTISRATGESGEPIYTDMAHDDEQFLGTGEYQFEIYRMMQAANKNTWDTFHPETNIFWMHYLVDKLMAKARYVDQTSKTHQLYMRKMDRFKDIILQFPSCHDFSLNYPHETELLAVG